jgi:hypothetical protein
VEQPPSFSLALRLDVRVGAPVDVGQMPDGFRRLVPILGGTVDGRGFHGEVLPGGADYQLIRANGLTILEARYVIQTDQGSTIYVRNRGIRRAAPDVAAKIFVGEPVNPADVYMRTTPTFETAAPDLQWLAQSMFVGTGERHPHRVLLQFWLLE